MKKATFWQQNKARAEKHEADEVLSYMTLMLERASAEDVPVRRQDFARHGKTVPLFRGAADWFDRVNARSRERHVKLQHYIISSGIKEMIEATKIGKKFAKVFARPSLTMQTAPRNGQRLRLITRRRRNIFSVNKGSLSVHDHGLINDFVPHEDRPMPFSNIVFMGDGDTDIPCMRLVRDQCQSSMSAIRGNPEKHMLALSSSQFDPWRKSVANERCRAEMLRWPSKEKSSTKDCFSGAWI